MKKKALSLPMELIIVIVVLIVVALAVIMFSTDSVKKVGGGSSTSIGGSNQGIACQSEAASYCATNTGPTVTECPIATCTSCAAPVSCGR